MSRIKETCMTSFNSKWLNNRFISLDISSNALGPSYILDTSSDTSASDKQMDCDDFESPLSASLRVLSDEPILHKEDDIPLSPTMIIHIVVSYLF